MVNVLRNFYEELKDKYWVIGLIIGIISMVLIWDRLQDFVRIPLLVVVILLVGYLIYLSFIRKYLKIPILFEESSNNAEGLFKDFIMKTKLDNNSKNVSKYIKSHLYFCPFSTPRNSKDLNDWKEAWNELVKSWESLDNELTGTHIAIDGWEYHIFPHVVLPLSFALGASIGLRCPLNLYHFQNKNYYMVLKIPSRNALFPDKPPSINPPEVIPEHFSTSKEKLILYIFVSERHKNEIKFDAHPDHKDADNVALYYSAIKPDKDWLPYVQWIIKKANELTGKYKNIDICAAVPSVIAFALGMAFSRTPKIRICHWTGSEYIPVFSLETIEKEYPLNEKEKRLPFT